MFFRRFSFILGLALAGAAHGQPAFDKPLHMLVGFAPGGANDILARIVANELAARVHQPVTVENRPGNAGLIAAEALAKSPPDGTTLMLGSTGTQTMAPHLARRLGFDPLASFAAVSLVGSTPNALAVRANLPAQDLEDLIELAKRRPGFLTYASSGNGTTLHLAGVLFARMADVELVHVSYKGNAPALNDVVAGRVDMIFSPLPPLLPFLRSGRVRVLGIAATDRLASAQEIPTLAEQGLPGYESGTWYGVFARAGTPQALVDGLSADIRASLQDRKVREALLAQGVEPKASTPRQFDALFRSDYARWGKVIKDAGVKPD